MLIVNTGRVMFKFLFKTVLTYILCIETLLATKVFSTTCRTKHLR